MKKITTCFFGVLVAFSSCSDFLKPNSNTDFVPKEVSSLEEMMIGEVYYTNINTIAFLNILDDDVDGGHFIDKRNSAIDGVVAAYSWQPDMFETLELSGFTMQWANVWSDCYHRILGCNAVLDYVNDVSGSQISRDKVKAEALVMRGFTYLHLVNVFGAPYNANKKALGVPLKLNSEIAETVPSRSTVEECYTSIEKDLLEAEKLLAALPASEQWKANYKASLPMAQLLLSRMYLYMEQWDKAYEYAEKVITNYSFRLKDLNEIVHTEKAPYYNFCDLACPEQVFLYTQVGDYTSFSSNLVTQGESVWNFVASHDLLKRYAESDLRRENYIINEPGYEKVAPEGMPWDTLVLRPAGKFGVDKNRNNISSVQMMISLRVAEAYLNSMEAAAFLYKNGDAKMLSQSVARLEELRLKRYRKDDYRKLGAFPSADELISYIREERRRELCFEAHRWFDLRRYGMPEIKHRWNINNKECVEYTLSEKDPAYVIPVPKSAREKNPSLIQNPLVNKRSGQPVLK